MLNLVFIQHLAVHLDYRRRRSCDQAVSTTQNVVGPAGKIQEFVNRKPVSCSLEMSFHKRAENANRVFRPTVDVEFLIWLSDIPKDNVFRFKANKTVITTCNDPGVQDGNTTYGP
jgi:hypothetical protein